MHYVSAELINIITYSNITYTNPVMKTKKRRALGTYILDNRGQPVVERDVLRWWDWFEQAENRVVRQDEVGRGVSVSTVFLGLDYNFWERGRPLLWETMIFGGRHDKYCRRYATREDALAGHACAVKIAKGRKNR
jgi:hypothetical protein